jgi:activator of HSP90 ATPase
MIAGRHVELVPGERIVQAWRATNWDEGVYSIVSFRLDGEGERTRITFDHTGYPADHEEMLSSGWHSQYWEPLAKYLA